MEPRWLFLDFPSALGPKANPKACTFTISATRLGNLLDFGQLFKAFGNN